MKVKCINIRKSMGVVGVIVVLVLTSLFCFYNDLWYIASGDGRVYFSSGINWNDSIELTNKTVMQTYITTRAEISHFGFVFRKEGTFEPEANIHINIKDGKTGELLQQWDTSIENQVSEEYMYSTTNYRMQNVFLGDRGRTINIEITTQNIGEKGKVYSAISKDGMQYGKLTVDGKQDNKQLAVNIYGATKYIGTIFICTSIMFLGILIVLYFLIRQKKIKAENIFLILGAWLGVLFLLLFTPGTEPDSDAHFATAYYDANVLMGKKDAVDENGNVMMRKDDLTKDRLTTTAGLHNINVVKENILKKTHNTEYAPYYRGRLSVPLGAHFPQALGIVIGIQLNLSATGTAYMGKIFALIFYLICCYLGVRLIPFGKAILATCALLPFSLEMATSYSYDCEVLALSFLMIGYVLYLACEKKQVNMRDILVWLILTCWIGPVKVVYVLLGGLILLVPCSSYKNKKMYIIAITATALAGGVSIVLSRLSFVTTVVSGSEAEYYTINMFLQDIPRGLLMIGHAVKLYLADWLAQMFGSMYSWLDVKLPFTFVIIYVVLILAGGIREENEKLGLNTIQKMIMIVSVVLITGGIFAGLMFGWTSGDAVAVEGIQGRYFLPIIPLITLLLRNKVIVSKRNLEGYILWGVGIAQYLTYCNLYSLIMNR